MNPSGFSGLMMPQLDEINITYANSDFYVIAIPADNRNGGIELAHLQLGNRWNKEVRIHPNELLTPGSYTLLMMGYGANGCSRFEGRLNLDGNMVPFHGSSAKGSGVAYAESIEFTVS